RNPGIGSRVPCSGEKRSSAARAGRGLDRASPSDAEAGLPVRTPCGEPREARRAKMNILYATDGSECAGTAGRLLAALPLPAGTHVTILSAIPESGWIEYPMLPEAASTLAAAERDTAHQVADEAAASLRDRGLEVDVRIRHGNPAEVILNQAAVDNADLI